jgi:hypothetical protein
VNCDCVWGIDYGLSCSGFLCWVEARPEDKDRGLNEGGSSGGGHRVARANGYAKFGNVFYFTAWVVIIVLLGGHWGARGIVTVEIAFPARRDFAPGNDGRIRWVSQGTPPVEPGG